MTWACKKSMMCYTLLSDRASHADSGIMKLFLFYTTVPLLTEIVTQYPER